MGGKVAGATTVHRMKIIIRAGTMGVAVVPIGMMIRIGTMGVAAVPIGMMIRIGTMGVVVAPWMMMTDVLRVVVPTETMIVTGMMMTIGAIATSAVVMTMTARDPVTPCVISSISKGVLLGVRAAESISDLTFRFRVLQPGALQRPPAFF